MLPLMIPMWFNTAFIEAPNGALVTFLSIFPLTAPVSMVARMVAVNVLALWQSLLEPGACSGYVLCAGDALRTVFPCRYAAIWCADQSAAAT